MEGEKKGIAALKRICAGLATINALKQANAFFDAKLWGYDYAEISKENTIKRTESLQRHLNETEYNVREVDKNSVTQSFVSSAELSSMQKTKQRIVRRNKSLLEEPSKFFKTNRGITSQSEIEYNLLKSADLKITYALQLLELDMNHYRYWYNERKRQNEISGHRRFYQYTPDDTTLPKLWIKDSSTVYKAALPLESANKIEDILEHVPYLWIAFAEERKREVAAMPLRSKKDRTVAIVSPVKDVKAPQVKISTLKSPSEENVSESSVGAVVALPKTFNKHFSEKKSEIISKNIPKFPPKKLS